MMRSNNAKEGFDDVTDLKRKLKGAGLLEYHIVPDSGEVPADEMQKDGRSPQVLRPRACRRAILSAGLKSSGPRSSGRNYAMQEYNKKQYALVWITPEKSMEPSSWHQGLEADRRAPAR